MREKVNKYIKKNSMLKKGDGVVVAVSGGPDSICLLHILKSLQQIYELRLIALHINHLLRGEKAEDDERFVKDICASWDIPCFTQRANIKKISEDRGISIEEAGREIRYNYFKSMMNKNGFQKIALGQHGDDNAETILMRLIRGTGPKGLAGIPSHRADGVIRPLLSCSRLEIEEYCRIHKLETRIDESNLKPIYFRNKIRLEVIPYLEKFNGKLRLNLQHMSEIINEQQAYIEVEMLKLWQKNTVETVDGVIFSMEWLVGLSIFQKKEMLRRSIERVKDNLKEIEYTHINLILEMLENNSNTTWILHLPHEIRVERQYQQLIVKKEQDEKDITFQYYLPRIGNIFIPEINKEFNIGLFKREEIDIINNDSKKAYFDAEKVGQNLIVRNRRPGDTFRPIGFNGTKKLKNYFIDLKVPREYRDQIPIIIGEYGIIWVAGYRADERYAVDKSTKIVLTIEWNIREENNNGIGS